MDYTALALERHTETLKRLLSYVLVYIGLADDTGQAMRFIRKTATQWDTFSGGGGGADAVARAFHAMGDPGLISRRVHHRIKRLLFPMEAATRRLIIVFAAKLPDPKIVPSMLKPHKRVASTVKLVTLPRTWNSHAMVPRFLQPTPPPPPEPAFKPPQRIPRFALLDPLKRFNRRRTAGRHACQPRIATAGGERNPIPLYIPQSPYDRVSSARLMRRVTALASALDDPRKQAQRYARWRALSAARRANDDACGIFVPRRRSAMRGGPPPGSPAMRLPEDKHGEEHMVLADLHSLARYSQSYHDTS